MDRAYIQVFPDGMPINESAFSAMDAFNRGGAEIVPFRTSADITDPDPEHIVVGGIGYVQDVLRKLKVILPREINYPDGLVHLCMNGEHEILQMLHIRQMTKTVFCKPAFDRKLSTGMVVRTAEDLMRLSHVPDQTRMIVSRPVDLSMATEWRCFYIDQELVGVRPYSPAIVQSPPPSPGWLKALPEYWGDMPAGCAIDVFTCPGEPPERPIIEVTDGFSLGSYGLPAHLYGRLLEARWKELVAASTQV